MSSSKFVQLVPGTTFQGAGSAVDSEANGVGSYVQLFAEVSHAWADRAVDHAVKRALESQKDAVRKAMPAVGGVLVVVITHERIAPDVAGYTPRLVKGVYVAGADASPEIAVGKDRGQSQMFASPGKGWKIQRLYFWFDGGAGFSRPVDAGSSRQCFGSGANLLR